MTEKKDDNDQTEQLQATVHEALNTQSPLSITAGNSKSFYGRKAPGSTLSVREHVGIINYQATELVITARAGTRLNEIESALNANQQMLAFEPPHFAETATLGGTIACGFSGPSRPWRGAARDFVLGCRIINGKGEVLRFGGEVMKNVAGYDVSRLMTGSLGTLGLLLDISLKVLPKPTHNLTLQLPCLESNCISLFSRWRKQNLPMTAAIYFDGAITLRLSGSQRVIDQAREQLAQKQPGVEILEAPDFWPSIREHQHPFFLGEQPLWRLSLPPATPIIKLNGTSLIDWAGGQRWLRSEEPAEKIRQLTSQMGGHATLFKHGNPTGDIFHPLIPGNHALHQRIKHAFDPNKIFNPGRQYPDL